ncbi:MAG: phage minor head protein, partial [Bacteroides sp.]
YFDTLIIAHRHYHLQPERMCLAMKCSCDRLIKSLDAYISKADDDLADALTEAGFIEADSTVTEAAAIEEQVAAALTGETDYILNGAKEAIDLEAFAKTVWPNIKAGDMVAQDLFEIFLEEFNTFMPTLVSGYIAQLDGCLILDQISKRTKAWIKSWSEELAGLMKLDSHTQIDNLLTTALDKGQSVAELTQSIMDSGIRDEYYRARRVSITETLRAHSYASEEAILQAPVVEEKEWVHTGAYRNTPRENHVAMDGIRVPKKEAFTLEGADGGTYYPMFPRDSILPAGESINCHCIHRGIVSEQVLGLPIEERRRLQEEAVAEMDEDWEKELDAKNKAKAGI